MITVEIKKAGEGSFTDRTDQISALSLTFGTTKEATTGRLSVRYYAGKYQPDGEDQVEIYDGATKIFGGYIVRLTQKYVPGPHVVYECDLKNKVHLLDRKLVNVSYEGETAHDIIEDIVANFSGTGITTTNVEDDLSAVVTEIFFNNIAPSEAIQQIAELFGKEWYIDAEGDIHFFSKFAEEAPFDITDTNGKIINQSLQIRKDYTQIRNSILVEGGKEKSSSTATDSFVGDGTQHTFSLSREFTDIAVTVNAVSKTVGIANVDTFATKDCLYDFNLRSLQFNPASPPANGHAIVVTGKYYFPINVRFRESISIGLFGERQFFIQDSSIKSRSDAIERASAEITAYASQLNEGSFTTYESGLKAGQKININSAALGVNEDFVIQRISASYRKEDQMLWNVEIVSVKTYELIDLLAQIIRGSRRESPQNPVISVAERFNRTIEVDREILTYFNDPPIWVAGPWPPVSLADRRRMPFADRTCKVT